MLKLFTFIALASFTISTNPGFILYISQGIFPSLHSHIQKTLKASFQEPVDLANINIPVLGDSANASVNAQLLFGDLLVYNKEDKNSIQVKLTSSNLKIWILGSGSSSLSLLRGLSDDQGKVQVSATVDNIEMGLVLKSVTKDDGLLPNFEVLNDDFTMTPDDIKWEITTEGLKFLEDVLNNDVALKSAFIDSVKSVLSEKTLESLSD